MVRSARLTAGAFFKKIVFGQVGGAELPVVLGGRVATPAVHSDSKALRESWLEWRGEIDGAAGEVGTVD